MNNGGLKFCACYSFKNGKNVNSCKLKPEMFCKLPSAISVIGTRNSSAVCMLASTVPETKQFLYISVILKSLQFRVGGTFHTVMDDWGNTV
uniref:Uncharacterized protein n=1 Tax=Pyxicephalus adspersus TaxID=30357 RepID=A0AAV2ZV12_PYXAD|nr:TPA: hypothetical protein GDO54_004672 [Pyxicephalus adspersus]